MNTAARRADSATITHATDRRSRRVLILHQHSGVCRALGPWLQQRGHMVHLLDNVETIPSILSDWPADLVVVEIDDVGVEPVSLIQRVRETAHAVRRYIVISGRYEAEQILATVDEPRMHVYLRPFSPHRMLRDIETLQAGPAGVIGPTPTAAHVSRFVAESASTVGPTAGRKISTGDVI